MSSIFNMLGAMTGGDGGGTNILLQALGAAMRGESPQAFMKKLANSHPQLKKINLNDLQGEAQRLASENGVSVDDVKKQIDDTFAPHMK